MSLFKMIFISLIVFSFSSCCDRRQRGELPKNGVTQTGEAEKYKEIKEGSLKDWKWYKLGNAEWDYPPEWKIVNAKNTCISLNMDTSDSMTYLNVTILNPAFHDTTYIAHFKNIYSALSSNTSEVYSKPVLERFVYYDKIVYDLRLRSIINQVRYVTLLWIFNRDGFTYEIVMKMHEKNASEYYNTFNNILYSYRVNGHYVFNPDDRFKTPRMDISKLLE